MLSSIDPDMIKKGAIIIKMNTKSLICLAVIGIFLALTSGSGEKRQWLSASGAGKKMEKRISSHGQIL